jgi:hypothetical protein
VVGTALKAGSALLQGPYVFSDDATTRLGDAFAATAAGLPVPAGRYRSQDDSNTSTSPMTAFNGLSGANLNGQWRLRFTDNFQNSVGCVRSANLYVASSGGQTGAPPRATLARLPGSNTLTLTQGAAGVNYVLQRSTNLAGWTNLQTLTTTPAGGASHTDSSPPGGGRAFYRFALPF